MLRENSPNGPALANVSVSAEGAQSLVSGVDGRFDLRFPSKAPGAQINLTLVKDGYVVIYPAMLHPILSSNTNGLRTTILMSKPRERKEKAWRYFRLEGEEAAERNFEEQDRQLEVTHAENVAVAHERLGDQLDLANAMVAEAAEDFAKETLGANSNVYQHATWLFIDGQFNEALDVLDPAKLQAQRSEGQTGNQELVSSYKLRGEILALRFQFGDAAEAYASAVELDSNNFGANIELGLLDQSIGRVDEAEKSFNQCLKLGRNAGDPMAIAKALNKLGDVHIRPTRMDEAENEYNEALAISRQWATNDPQRYLPVAANALDNLGHLYLTVDAYHKYRPEEGFKAYEEALKIYRQLAVDEPALYLPHVSRNLYTMGVLYSDEGSWAEAGKKLEEALPICRQVATNFPNRYQPVVATMLDNLGYIYLMQNQIEKCRKAYAESLSIYQTLAKDCPDLFEPKVKRVQEELR